MSTCRWCTPGGLVTIDLLKEYAAGNLHDEDLLGANEDLSYCMECVLAYHVARDKLPHLHTTLWKIETSRLIVQLEKSLQEEIEEDDDLFLVEEDGEKQLFGYTGANFESNLRVPLLESLKYPYLLLSERVSQLCVEALCKMEQVNNPFQVYDKVPGVYLFLVHPDENIRRWAIGTARSLGKVERDDYYDLQEVFTCLFKVIELGLFENPDIYSTDLEEGKLILLPSHLYDTTNYKNYWLGICMLLTVLEEPAMDSLLLGPDKQTDLMQSILHVMEKHSEDESLNPFWPALHCFMLILDRLGSKVWGQLIDPIQAFQTIIASPSYNNEIENIRRSCREPSKSEPETSEDDDLVTCSQMVYSFNTEKKKKDTGWKNAICPDYCPNMYEEMQCLANVLQSDIGQDMRVHDSTFLWFVPYVQSVMDLKDLGVAYIMEVIHHLYSEIKDMFNQRYSKCDKVTELFILVLVSIIELHRNKKCLHLLWVSSHKWVEALVKCALLPSKDQQLRARITSHVALSSSPNSPSGPSVQYACIQLIRSLLREGYQLGQQSTCKLYLDKLNMIIRSNVFRSLELTKTETQGLQACLTQIIKSVKDKTSATPNSSLEQASTSKTQSVPFIKIERLDEDEDIWYGSDCSSPVPCTVIKPSTSVEGVCRPVVKREPQESGILQLEGNPFIPGCSSGTSIRVKKEIPENPDCLSSVHNLCTSTVQPNLKPKRPLSDWQSKLSKVMQKSSSLKSKKERLVPPQNNEESPSIQSRTLAPPKIQIKTEPCDQMHKTLDADSSHKEFPSSGLKRKLKEENIDSLPVAKQMEKLSLEQNQSGSKTVSVKGEYPLECEKELVINSVSTLKTCLEPQTKVVPSPPKNIGNGGGGEDDDDDDLPLTEVRKKLLKGSSNLTNTGLYGDLSQEMTSQEPCQIERKVKGAVRSSVTEGSSSDTELSSDQIILISDSSSEGEITPRKKVIKTEKLEDHCPSTSGSSSFKPVREDQIKPERYSQTCDEYNSQLFEFETEDDVFSVWEDSQIDQRISSPDPAKQNQSSSPESNKSNIKDFTMDYDCNQWGYDTDYICDDVIEKAADDAEKEFESYTNFSCQKEVKEESCSISSKNDPINSKTFYGKELHTSSVDKISGAKMKPSTPKKAASLSPRASLSKKTEAAVTQKRLSKSRVNKTKSPLKAQAENKKLISAHKPSLAVVPPKKIRPGPEPTSTVEKLGLKKGPRKAFDLSQRSLDSLAELRDYGKSAGMVLPERQKTKLISPKSLLVKGNKRLLACQDLQFYRQSRPKEVEKEKRVKNSERGSRRVEYSKQTGKEDGSEMSSAQRKHKNKNGQVDSSAFTRELQRNICRPCEVPEDIGSTDDSTSVSKEGETSGALTGKIMQTYATEDHTISSLSTTGKESDNKEAVDDDDDNLFLTQPDPVDMDLCSQVDNEIEFGDGSDGLSSIAVPSASLPETPGVMCKYKDCSEAVIDPGDHCAKHTLPEKADDHVFAKPSLPPSFPRPAKPSTAKVYGSSSTSRTAALSKDLENVPKVHAIPKAKIQPLKPPLPRLTMPPSAQYKPLVVQGPGSVLQPLINQNNIPKQGGLTATSEPGKLPQHQIGNNLVQRDQAWLMREVLHWKYEMFDNVSQFGPPTSLCQLPLMKVPLKFSGYEEYFNVFFPLMLLNTFESLAQEWLMKQRAIGSHICRLHLQNFCLDSQVNRGDFQAWFRDADLSKQCHPKEDDLVFLLTPEANRGMSGEEGETPPALVYHTGHVSRFTRSQRTQILDKEQYTLCDLCIHTYGNLSGCRNQQVQCVVIGSLITTQRQYKALLLLQRNQMFRPIIYANPTDFMPRDNLPDEITSFPSLKEYNSDQKYAIERAHAMVKQHPRLPRICMIHGPPGTGKSKTIVGLLYRILMENTSNNPPYQNLNAKNKRNRVLVCAPSNAAIDDLMKKIILEFKEKCHDKKNTLGNCGDINLVRLGAERMISSDVIKFSLDCQVNYRINRAQQDQTLHKRKEALDRQLDELSRQRAMERCNKNTCEQLDEEIAKLSMERQLLANTLKEFRRRPQELQRNIILESHVICCTLSTSGGFLLESAFRQLGQEPFSCVIVDEAGQTCEVENLIPLLHRCSKLVLVGDPEQLPPTVISVKAEELGYGQSLMSRLCRHFENTGTKTPVLQLTVQYRMHPDICLFPSNYFYKRVLKTDRAVEEVRCSSDWPFQPYMVFDVADGYEMKERESFANPQEIKLVLALMKLIKSKKKEFCFRNIGIITPYRAQKMMIIDQLRKVFGNDARPGEVDTVDGFQGRQKDCIIVTCVRANATQGSIGFLASRQRLNVTITRAKFSLFILGNLRTLMENNDWNHLIQDAKRRGALIKTKEDGYQRDVNKILKLKPVVSLTPSRPDDKYRDVATHPPHREVCSDSNNAPKMAVQPPTPRPVVHPAVNHSRDLFRNLPGSSIAPTPTPVPMQRQRDPRLARQQDSTEQPQRTNTPGPSRQRSAMDGKNHYQAYTPSRTDNRQPRHPNHGSGSGGHTSGFYRHRDSNSRKSTSEQDREAKRRKTYR
ncbi:putative helicase senataxin [Pelodytes ibericus]